MIFSIFVQRIDWNGITVEVSYEPDWLSMSEALDEPIAHLQIRSLSPDDAPLPVTETGYRSHFIGASEVLEQGGPVSYVRAWLDEAAQSTVWKDQQAQARQFSLFF